MPDKCYIVAYDLKHDSTALNTAIKGYGTWAKITENTWAVVTKKSAVEVRNHLKAFILNGDRLFVLKSGVEAAWTNAACTNEWLKKNI